jgi:uncharacterized protein YodC (DUF2158 family)
VAGARGGLKPAFDCLTYAEMARSIVIIILLFFGENGMSEFKPGDVVVLKSGGPKMTVDQTEVSGSGRTVVWCDWFEGNRKVTATFPSTSLEAPGK